MTLPSSPLSYPFLSPPPCVSRGPDGRKEAFVFLAFPVKGTVYTSTPWSTVDDSRCKRVGPLIRLSSPGVSHPGICS